jgi:hypothetical protein
MLAINSIVIGFGYVKEKIGKTTIKSALVLLSFVITKKECF